MMTTLGKKFISWPTTSLVNKCIKTLKTIVGKQSTMYKENIGYDIDEDKPVVVSTGNL